MKASTLFSKAVSFLSITNGHHHEMQTSPTGSVSESALLLLPPEVLLIVVEHLNSTKALRLTCRQLNSLLQELTLCTVVINIFYENLEASLLQLQSLAQGWEKSAMTRKLKILGLRPTFMTKPDRPGSPPRRKSSHFEKQTRRATAELIRYLPLALAPFTRLNVVEVHLHHQDVPGSWQLVMDWLPTLRHAHEFIFDASEASSAALRQLSFGGLPYIRTASLNLKWPYATFHASGSETLNRNLSRLILQSPRLSSLSISVKHSSLAFFAPFERTFLCTLNESSPGLPNLTSLRLEGQITLNPTSLRQFPHLTSLHLENWQARMLEYRGELDGDLSSSKLWRYAKKNGVSLEDVTAGLVPELIDYLGSYKGLRNLSLSLERGRAEELPSPTVFYQRLEEHRDTLISADIRVFTSADLPDWYFGPSQASSLSHCYKLQFLHLPIPYEKEALQSCMDALFNIVIPNLPDLRTIVLRCHLWSEMSNSNPLRERLETSRPWDATKNTPSTIVAFRRGEREIYVPHISHNHYQYTLLQPLS